jgi:hypothetical protein
LDGGESVLPGACFERGWPTYDCKVLLSALDNHVLWRQNQETLQISQHTLPGNTQ